VNVLGGALQTNGALTVANALSLNTGGGALTVSGGNNLTLSGVISGPGSLVENTTTTGVVLTLAGATANSYSGSTVVNAGTLTLAKTAAVAAVVGPLVLGDGAGGINSDLVTVTTSNSQITGNVTVNPSGQLNMNALTATIGALILNAGSETGTAVLTLGGNVQTLSAASAATISGLVGLGANRSFNVAFGVGGNNPDLITIGVMSGAFDLTKMGGGVFNVGNGAQTTANSFTGQTTVAEGTLVLAMNAAVNAMTGALAVGDFSGTDTVRIVTNFNNFNTAEPVIVNSSGTLDVSGSTVTQTFSTLDVRGGTVTTGSNIFQTNSTITGVATSTIGSTIATGTIAGKLNLTGSPTTINVADSGTTAGLAISALVSGAVGLTKGGAGTLQLTGTVANTYTGVTTVNAGVLLLNDSGGVAIPAALTIGDFVGGTGVVKADVVRFLRNNQIPQNVLITVNNSGLLDLNGFSNTVGVGLTNALSLVGGSVATGAGTLTLASNIADLVNLSSQTPATISGNLSLGGATRTVDVQPGFLVAENPNATSLNPNDLVITAIISNGGGAAGLIKNNTGSLQLTGNNTYTGPTTVNAGSLLVDGSQTSSTVTVNSGAALGGIGTTGAILANGGGVNPGDPINSLGTLSGPSADFSGNGSLTIQAAGTSPAGISTDLLNLSGALKLSGAGTSTLILDVAQLATTGTALGVIHFGSITGTFTNVTLINNPNNYQATLVYNANSIDVTFSVSATSHLAFSVQPGTTTAGVAISPAVTVRVLDSNNNLVTSDNTDQVTLTVASGPGGFTAGSTTTVTVSGGIATFSNLVLNAAGSYTLGEAGTGGLAGPASGSFNVNPAAANHLAVGVQPGNTVAGVVISPAVTVRVLDQFNNLVSTDTSNVTVAIGSNPGSGTLSGTTTVAAVGGIASFSTLSINKVGTGYTLTAADGSLTGTTSGSFNISPAAANHLAFGVQPTTAVAGVAISPAVTVQVLDAFGNLVSTDNSNVTIVIGNNPSAGTLSGTTTVAASGGIATFSTLSINKVGTGYTLSASDGSLGGSTSGAFNITPSAADHLAFLQQPTTAVAGVAISPAVKVQVLDQFNNLVTTDTSNVTVAIGTNPSGGTLSGTQTVAASGGIATFSTLSINKTGLGYTLAATDASLGAGTSAPFNITPAAADHLAFSQQPISGVTNTPLNPAPTVVVLDHLNNVVTTDTSTVTMTIANNPNSGTLGGTTSVAAVGGVATFSNLKIDNAGQGYTLNAADGSLTTATTNPFNISPTAQFHLVFGQQPSNAVAGVAISPAITVMVEDPFGDIQTGDTTSVTLVISTNPGSGTLSGTLTEPVVNGVATFSDLSINKAGVGYVLSALDGLYGAGTSNTFNITPAAANHLAFLGQPSTAVAGVAISPAVKVQVLDQFNNLVTTDTSNVTVAIGTNTGGGTLSGTTTVAASGGIATFSNLSINKTGAGYTLTAADGSLGGSTSTGFNITPAAANHLAILGQPSTAVAGVAINPAVKVEVLDPFDNLVTTDTSNVTVAIGTNPGGGTLSGTTTVAASGGIATFNTLSINKTGTGYTLTAADGSLTGTTSGSFNITPAVADHLGFGVQPSTAVAGVAISPAVTVQVLDQFNNLVTTDTSNVTVLIGINPGGGTLSGTLTVPASGGVATFSTLSINKTGTGYTLAASDGSLAAAISGAFNITPAAANHLAILGQPSNAVAGVAISPAVTVQVLDQFNNLVTGDTSNVTVAIGTNPGGGTLSGTTTVAASGGIATFSNLSINKTGTGYALAASDASLAAATSGAFNITPAAASQLVFTTAPQTVTAGVVSGTITVQEQDQFGNVTTTAETVNLSTTNPGTGLFKDNATGATTITSVTIPAGSSTASFKYVDTLASSPTLTAVASGLTSANQTETIIPKPTVTIDQHLGQADPTNVATVAFDVHFSVPVTGFDSTDVSLVGSTAGGSLVAAVTAVSGQDYVVTVTGMTSQGTVIASIPADIAQDAAGSFNIASTSTDNSVLFDNVPPTVTINQSGVIDPTNTTVSFNVHFSEPVTGFGPADVSFAGTTGGLTPTASVTGSGQDYVVTASGMHGIGTIVASIPAGAAQDAAGNLSTASTSTDNTIGFDDINPTVTINQGAGQVDPTSIASIVFDIHFNKPMSGFTASDVVITGTAGGTLSKLLSGSGADYTLTVTGMTSPGTVIANIPASVAQDVAGNGNQASTSTDNSVLFDTIGSLQFSAPTYTVAENGVSVTISVTRTGGSANAVSVQFATVTGGTATAGADYTSTNGTLNWANGDTATKTFTVLISDDNLVEPTETVNLALSSPTGGAVLGSQSTAVLNITDVEEGVLQFQSPTFTTNEDGVTTAHVIVTRTATTGAGAVSVNFATSDGTAISTAVGANPKDYTATTQTVSWADGDLAPKTVDIPINDDSLNEGRETIILSLTTPTNGARLGGTPTAVLTIQPSDGIVIDGTAKSPQGVSTDSDGDLITMKLTGKVGTATYYRTDPDGDGKGPIELIKIAGTDPASGKSVAAALTITAAKAKGGTGNGAVNVGAITGSTLKSITAKKTDIDGDGINMTGYVGSVTVKDVTNGADILLNGAAPDTKSTVKITTGVIGDNTTIDVKAPVASLTATQIGVGTITAPSIGTLTTKGSTTLGVAGDFLSNLTLSGVGVAVGKPTLKTMSVKGVVNNVVIDVTGAITSVTVGAFVNSRLFASYSGPDDGSGTFTAGGDIGTFKVTGKTNSFAHSFVIASNFKNVSIASMDPDNGGTKFGIVADNAVKALSAANGTTKFKYNAKTGGTQDLTGTDFEVKIV
jgi:autotransporter-associated beta strand protein